MSVSAASSGGQIGSFRRSDSFRSEPVKESDQDPTLSDLALSVQ